LPVALTYAKALSAIEAAANPPRRRSSLPCASSVARRIASTTIVPMRMSLTGYARLMIFSNTASSESVTTSFSPTVHATKISARKTIAPSSHNRSRVEVPRGMVKKVSTPPIARGMAAR
jgi:hypothetical protein